MAIGVGRLEKDQWELKVSIEEESGTIEMADFL
jgi:hypothetical protein